MRQSFVLHMGRVGKGTALFEVSLAIESDNLDLSEQQDLIGRISSRCASVVQEEYGGQVLPLPRGQQGQ